MNEVKHAWSALKSSSKTSSLNWRNSESDNASTTTWYDAPAPIIIHCREFRNEESAEKDQQEDNKKKKNKKKKSEEFAEEKEKQETDVEEALYENNAEILATSECSNNKIQRRVERSDASSNLRVEQSKCSPRRHSSTVELTATTSVKTNEDGLPTIRFSFLPYKEQSQKNVDAAGSEESFDENGEAIRDQLYDIPKCPLEQDKEVAIVAENDLKMMMQSQKKKSESSESEEFNEYEVASHLTNELYDIPKSLSDKCVNESSRNLSVKKEDSGERKIAAILLFKSKRDRLDRTKRSTRSLKTGRKNYGMSESNVYERGVTSMSGSYSDSECPNDSSSNVSRGTSRLKLEKQRLGKAWGKMRTWLRDERTKIGEVVQRHARMQAVGALSGDEDATTTALNKIGKTVKSGSYDLTKAEAPRNAEEFGSVTRVEEFGLASVSEEANSCEVVVDASTDERPASNFSGSEKDLSRARTNERHDDEFFVAANLKNLCKKTVSSDDILGCNESKKKFSAVSSVSMDKLCAKVESAANGDENTENETSSRERAGRGGMIKRRMLGSIRGLMASTHLLQASEIHEEAGQGGFEDVRRYVKQGGDFCKELASILHERAELEAMYAKGLSKLSNKLTKACAKDQGGNSTGGVNEAWRCVGEEMEAAAEAHRVWGIALGEQLAKPLRIGVAEAQGRSRKSIENSVDKASKSLQEWRGIAAKSKKHSFTCARENERLQDLARLQSISQSQQNNNKSSNHHMTEKEASKLESRRRKAEDSSRRADTEFYTVSVRAERARLEYESTVRKGAKQMELLEEERLSALKDLANVYLAHLQALAPRLQQSADRLSTPVRNCNVAQDVEILKNLIRRIESNDAVNAEQLLPDFYAEHITLAMNRERRKQALVRILHLIRQDLERERRGREGLETLHRAFIKTPAFAADESTQNVTEKLHHMRSMLFYLEAARYKVGGTLAEVEGSKRNKHPLAEHILVSRDKQGLQQSVLKIPSWGRNESFEIQDMDDELEVHLTKDHEPENRDWADRTAGDGNSENPPDEEDFSDFDEFSSHSEDNNNQDIDVSDVATTKSDRTEQCRAIYHYAANFHDELSLNPGDLITVHQKQADGWWIGECRGRTGIFPATYVQVIH